MALFEWNDSYSVNIKTIDDQHKTLIGMINGFYEGIKNDKGNEALASLVRQLKNYTITHFSTEERYFAQHGYPDTEAHKAKHKAFVDKVGEIENRLKTGQLVISFEITTFLKNWLKEHILDTDKHYSSFLVSKGVK